MTRTGQGEFNKTVNLILTRGEFFPEGSEYGGNFMTEFAPFLSSASITFPAKDCAEAVSLINELADRKDLGKVYIKPVFARIKNIPNFHEFSIRVRSQLSLSCDELELGRKSNS